MQGEVDARMSRQLDIKGAGLGLRLLQREAGEQGLVPEATGWREEGMVLVVCRPAAGQV